MRLPILILLLVAAPVWAATGTSSPETWYVRPVADCPANGDGLAYNCAASAGASGAFSKLVNLLWTTTTGIDDGDTLKICGSFGAADKRNATTMLDLVATAASEEERITVTGDCSAEGGAGSATIDGEHATSSIVIMNSTPSSYITLTKMHLTGGKTTAEGGGGASINMGTGTGNRFTYSTIAPSRLGIIMGGAGGVVDHVDFLTATQDIDAIAVGVTATTFTISSSTLRSNVTGNSSDVIDIDGTNIVTATISGNHLYKGSGDKSAVTVKAGAGVYRVVGNEIEAVGDTANSVGYAIRTQSGFEGSLIIGQNRVHGFGNGTNLVQLDAAGSAGSAIVYSNIFEAGGSQLVINDSWSVSAYNNDFVTPGIYGVYSSGTATPGPTSVTLYNNVFDGSARHVNSLGNEGTFLSDYNAFSGGGDLRLDGTVYADLSAAQAGTDYESNSLSEGRIFLDRTMYRLAPSSSARRAGRCYLDVGCSYPDIRGYRGRVPPDIGAYQRN